MSDLEKPEKTVYEKSLDLHANNRGKFKITSKVKVENNYDLSLAYTPGVAAACLAIKDDKENAYKYTTKGNMIAVITDGTAVLGLGDIGPSAAMPVMEGKSILFKEFANVDAIPLCIDSKDTEEIIKTIKNIAPSFGGINLEDISAPRCFEIERRLQDELDIPIFHDDQHGTAIVTCAGLINAAKVVNKKMSELNIVISGPGAAGISIAKLLLDFGVGNIVLVGRKGAVAKGEAWLNDEQKHMATITNKHNEKGSLKDIIKGKDVLIGVSGPNTVNEEMVASMAKDSIVFAMANPVPEIMPDLAKKAGAKVVATGRSDFPNQINNVLVFPGIFRGVLDARSKVITQSMKIEAAKAIANIIDEKELSEDFIIPSSFDKRVAPHVAQAVVNVAKKEGLNRI
ncbi:NADP-dependent malic enzyme [Helicobacter sp. 11S02629-2]|uniref:NAD(P)-dependent malic enzyme n=1 Tax=Helicobacter sp. 11S02629-2 TaxID=1476195 RepID=UPI000BA7683B|nr:NADP-dependent malic enzyme [Helicobacter sp. 11S02629-2]PAF45417.1 NAD-dependent malic enzyme [Helicobacter sp. 11S02629-2]